jgi:hypothetical protein
VPDALAALVAEAEVEVQDDRLHVRPVLHVQRAIQPEVLPDLGDELRRRLLAGAQRRRIAGRQGVEDHERHRAHQREQDEHPDDTANDVTDHRGDAACAAVNSRDRHYLRDM